MSELSNTSADNSILEDIVQQKLIDISSSDESEMSDAISNSGLDSSIHDGSAHDASLLKLPRDLGLNHSTADEETGLEHNGSVETPDGGLNELQPISPVNIQLPRDLSLNQSTADEEADKEHDKSVGASNANGASLPGLLQPISSPVIIQALASLKIEDHVASPVRTNGNAGVPADAPTSEPLDKVQKATAVVLDQPKQKSRACAIM